MDLATQYQNVYKYVSQNQQLQKISNLYDGSVSTQKSPILHITNIQCDRGDLKQLLSSFKGFLRVIFHTDSCYAIFLNEEQATKAIEQLHLSTLMNASYAPNYTPFQTVPSTNPPNSTLRIRIFPSNITNNELTKILKSYNGFKYVTFYEDSCIVYFQNTDFAKFALEDLNVTTNLITNYVRSDAKKLLLTYSGNQTNTKQIKNSNKNLTVTKEYEDSLENNINNIISGKIDYNIKYNFLIVKILITFKNI